MIKRRDFDVNDLKKKGYKLLAQIEDYYLFEYKGDIIFGGIKLINLHLLSPALFTYQIKHWKNLDEKEFEYFKDNFEKTDILYCVGIITLNSLRKFKYIENLNILTLVFKNKENAWFMLDILERLRHIEFKIQGEINEIIKNTENNRESKEN
jgi:hypothetical protein